MCGRRFARESKRGRMTMTEGFTAVMKRSGSWWIGWVAEVPGVNCQERTKEALLETIEVTLREALELNRREAIDAAGDRQPMGSTS